MADDKVYENTIIRKICEFVLNGERICCAVGMIIGTYRHQLKMFSFFSYYAAIKS